MEALKTILEIAAGVSLALYVPPLTIRAIMVRKQTADPTYEERLLAWEGES